MNPGCKISIFFGKNRLEKVLRWYYWDKKNPFIYNILKCYVSKWSKDHYLHILYYSSTCSFILSIIFQNSYKSGTVPSSWKKANIIPIFKKGEKKHPEKYCPTNLTSILCKVMKITYLIFYERTRFCEINNMVFFQANLLYSNF